MAEEKLSREEQAKKDERIAEIIAENQAAREKEARDKGLPQQAAPTNIADIAEEIYQAEQKKSKK